MRLPRLAHSLRSLRSGEFDRAGLRPALGPPTGGAGSAAVVPGGCAPRTPIASAAVGIVIGGMHG